MLLLASVLAVLPGSSPSFLAPGQPSSVRNDGRIIWQYWGQGHAHLQRLSRRANETWGKYSMAWRCADYWRRLNPNYEHRLLDESSAAELSPVFAALAGRSLDFALTADVLRLDLLSRYGGVWADITTCPVQPLDSYVSEKTEAAGFFAMMWEPFYDRQTRGNHTPGALENFDKDGPCVGKREVDKQGYHTIDNWFLVAPQPHNHIIDAWLDALTSVVKGLPDGAVPCRPKHCATMGDYVYHLPMCVLGQLYAENTTVRNWIDAMPAECLCQHGGNGSPRCKKVLDSVADGAGEGSMYDQRVDPGKWMYKSMSASLIDEDEYEGWISSKASSTLKLPVRP